MQLEGIIIPDQIRRFKLMYVSMSFIALFLFCSATALPRSTAFRHGYHLRHNVHEIPSHAMPTRVAQPHRELQVSLSPIVNSICKHTPFPDVCSKELSGFQINPFTVSPLDLVGYTLSAATSRVNEAYGLATNIMMQKGLSPLEAQCSGDCIELLTGVSDQMKLAAQRLSGLHGVGDLASLQSSLMDVKVWLSSSLSYQTACSDNFQVAPGSIQEQIQSDQAYLTQLLGVSLSLVDILSQVGNRLTTWLTGSLPPLPPPFIHIPPKRRLLATKNIDTLSDREGFPLWLPVSGRSLLQAPASSIANSANVVVAQDGTGKYTSIKAALAAIPKNYSGRYVIYIKQGVYNEVLNVSKDQPSITFLGDGIGKTIITGNRNVASGNYNTYRTSTVGITGSGFYARAITFRNTAGPGGHQAVAVRAAADFMVFYQCSFEGYQDTLYALSSRQFYRECQISGTVDFIFGNAIAVFQNCQLLARLPMQGQQNTYTAQGRKLEADISGFSFHNCTVQADTSLQNASYPVSTYLGRPWKAYSRVVFMQSEIGAVVDPAGWVPWNASNPFTNTLYYGEYGNRGAGSDTSKRVGWTGVHPRMSQAEALQFTVNNFIVGNSWLDALKVAYQATLSS